MGTEKSDTGREPAPDPGGGPSVRGPHLGPEEFPPYASLLRQYGEAMLRIGRLESQIGVHSAGSSEGGSGEASTGGHAHQTRIPELESLLARVTELEKRVGGPSGTGSESKGAESTSETPTPDRGMNSGRDAEISQLRLQVSSLANQLARAEQEPTGVQESGARRRSRDRHDRHPKWQFWRRSSRRSRRK